MDRNEANELNVTEALLKAIIELRKIKIPNRLQLSGKINSVEVRR